MNAPRFVFTMPRTVRSFFLSILAGLLLAGLLTAASQAGMKPASTHGLGAALGLISQVRASRAQIKAAADGHTPDGRTLLNRGMMRPGAILNPHAAAATIVPIPGGVQTYDVFNPPPAFRPEIGFGSQTAINNDSTNPPVFISNLLPTNLTPVWSRDETFIIFSSNRTLTGGIQPNGRFHLWAISVNGGEAFQITDSQKDLLGNPLPTGGGEFFPALSGSNNALAFTSDAQSPGVQNLYVLQSNNQFSPIGPFSFTALTALNNGQPGTQQALVNVSNPNSVVPLTIRSGDPNGTTTSNSMTSINPANSSQFTGFSQVQRPAFSASEQTIVFSALATAGTTPNLNGGGGTDPNPGHFHLYFLNTNTRGFSADSASYPGKLTEGPTDDTDPAYSPDGQFIAFATTATSVTTNTSNNQLGPTPPGATQDPSQSQSSTAGPDPNGLRSIFLLSGGSSASGAGFGTVITAPRLPGGRVTTAGTDNYGPAWSNFANQNQFTNPRGDFAYLAFSRGASPAATHDIYYLQVGSGVSSPNTERISGESNANLVVKLNTDDNAGETTAAGAGETANTGNTFEDAYPSWSPFLSIFSITYQSGNFNSVTGAVTNGRTVTYNDPVSGVPVEVAASVPEGGQVLNPDGSLSYTVGANYTGVQVSQVLNLDPPTLLRFNADEVVHVQAPGPNPVTGTANKLAGAGANRTVTLTVRLSDREAGIDDTSGPNGGPRVYVQIKDPSSKYQNSQNAEHKVFAKDRRYDAGTQTNHPSNDVTSTTMDSLVDNTGYGFEPGVDYNNVINTPFYDPTRAFIASVTFPFPNKRYVYPSYGSLVGLIAVDYVLPRGVHGGQWAVDATNNPDNTYIFIGTNGGGTNPGLKVNVAPPNLLGGDPRLFIPWGPEYECQVINPQFAGSGNDNAPLDSTPLISRFASTVSNPGPTVGDYVSPFWLAGVDDQGAFSGGTYTADPTRGNASSSGTDRPVSNYTTGGGGNTTRHPAEWLQLQRVPAAQQDNQGGVLYTVNFTAPSSGSDFYVDVIAYDKAAFPNLPNQRYTGARSNWRIYDNVGGFSTNQSVGDNDILLVSDYALGQKFASTTFSGRNSNLNLVPKLFGTESYLSDIDASYLPDSVYAGIPTAYNTFVFNPVVEPFFGEPNTGGFLGIGSQDPSVGRVFSGATPENGLGVNSYIDSVINDGTATTGGQPNVNSQRYSIWRILSRGPVPQRVLNSYLPNTVPQPPVVDPGDTSPGGVYKNVPAATVLDAHRCVVWLSPYTGDVLEDPGALDDPGTVNGVGRNSTTKNLTAFVQAGGRLCINGQDVGSTLTQGGALGNKPSTNPNAPNFLPDVLNATLATTGTPVRALAGAGKRITGNPQFDGFYPGNYPKVNGAFTPGGGPPYHYGTFGISAPVYPYQKDIVIGDPDFADSSFSQIPPIILPTNASIQGQPDTITGINGAVTDITYGAGGAGALVYHDDPYGHPATGATAGQLPNGGTGSRVVYAAFGLEALTNDYISSCSPNPDQNVMNAPPYDLRIPAVTPSNTRTEILHNIVNFLRTGQVTGTINQTAGTGQGVSPLDGATVYLVSATGNAPSARVTFSALTANGGRFTIYGVEPGTYFLSAVKPGFQRASSNTNTAFSVEGDVTVAGKTLTLTSLPPGSIAGEVKDTAGNPVSGATIVFTSQDGSITQSVTTPSPSIPPSVTPTDNYYLQNVPVTTYTGLATGPKNDQGLPEYQSASGAPSVAPDPPNDKGFNVPSNPTVDNVNFTLTPILATITGRVYDNTVGDSVAGGTLTGGATVTLVDNTGKAVPGVAPVTAAADGTYTITNIPPSPAGTTYSVTATKAGYSTTNNSRTIGTVQLGNYSTGEDIGLTPIPAGILTGQVTDSQTKVGVAGALVTFTSSDGTVTLNATADANGNYTIAKVPPGTYSATATGPLNPNGRPTAAGGPAQTVTVASAPPSTTVNFTVTTTPPSFAGTVTDSKTGKPLQGVVITITDSSGGSTNGTVVATTQTKADGTYATGTLPPGTYTISASLVGYANGSLPSQTIYNGDALTGQDIALMPVPPGSISGQVTDQQTGGPVVGAVVTITSSDGTVTLTSSPTDVNGNYSIPASALLTDPAGSYTGTAAGPNNANGKPEYLVSASHPVTVPSGTTATAVNFVLTEIPATLSGTVTDQQTNKGIPNVVLTLLDNTGKTVATATSAADGTYKINPVPAGQSPTAYTLNAAPPGGYFPGSLPLPSGISLGDALTLNIPLNEQATVVGLVTDKSTGQPLSNVTLTLTDTTTGGTVTTTPATITTANNTSTGPDGLPENYVATFVLTPGHKYAVAATKPNYNASSPVQVTPTPLTNTTAGRADIQLVSSIGTLGGLVSDATSGASVGGATVTVTSASGTVVATFITNGSATAGPDGKPLNYSGQVAQGTYTVTLTKGNRTPVTQTKIVVVGGSFNRVDFTGATGLPALYTFPGGQLYFLSLPYDYSSLGFDSLFGTLNTAPSGSTPNGNRSHVAVWDPLAGQYALDPTPPADTLRLGVGYWVFLKSTVNITQQGATPNTPFVPVSLHPSWNQIGVPSITPIPVSSLMFDNGAGGRISFATAISSQYHLVSPTLYSFDGTSYQPVTQSSVLQPTKAYWIKVFTDATVEIPTSGTTGTTGAALK